MSDIDFIVIGGVRYNLVRDDGWSCRDKCDLRDFCHNANAFPCHLFEDRFGYNFHFEIFKG